MASEIRVDKINSLSGVGTVTLSPTGVDISGITTVATFKVGTGVTASSDGDIFATGVCTATTFSGSGASLTNLPAANITGTLPAISGANLTNLDASDLASGTVPTARLGSGTASSSTFLRGDSTFAAVTSTTINNNADNKVITGSGTANTLNAEGNVYIDDEGDLGLGISDITPTASTYNGATLQLHQGQSGSYGSQLKMTTASGGYAAGDGFYIAHWGGNNGTYIYNKENAALYFGTNAAERFRIGDSSNGGNVTVTDGNLVFGGAGHGIDFSSSQTTTSASGSSATSELLDHYEEGTFTPEYNSGSADSACFANGITYQSQEGHYTKVGNLVTFQLKLDPNSSGLTAKSGTLQINNLPFNCKNVQTNGGAFFVLTSCFGATDTLPNPVMITGSNGIQFYKNNAGGFAGTDLPVPSNYIQLAGVYLTD